MFLPKMVLGTMEQKYFPLNVHTLTFHFGTDEILRLFSECCGQLCFVLVKFRAFLPFLSIKRHALFARNLHP